MTIEPQDEDIALPDRGYRPEWEAQSVALFLKWRADCDAHAHRDSIAKSDAMRGFKPIPDSLAVRFRITGRTALPAGSIAMASRLAAAFVSEDPSKDWLDESRIDELRRISDAELAHMAVFLDEMENAGIVCKTCRHNVPALAPLISAHCLIGIIGRWQKDLPRMGRALALIKDARKPVPETVPPPALP